MNNPREFFESLLMDKLPAEAVTFIEKELLTDTDLNFVSMEDEEMSEVFKVISERFPRAIGNAIVDNDSLDEAIEVSVDSEGEKEKILRKIEGYELAMEFADGNEKEEFQRKIDGYKLALEMGVFEEGGVVRMSYTKRQLMQMAYSEEELRNIDTALPMDTVRKINELGLNSTFFVMNYYDNVFGRIENIASMLLTRHLLKNHRGTSVSMLAQEVLGEYPKIDYAIPIEITREMIDLGIDNKFYVMDYSNSNIFGSIINLAEEWILRGHLHKHRQEEGDKFAKGGQVNKNYALIYFADKKSIKKRYDSAYKAFSDYENSGSVYAELYSENGVLLSAYPKKENQIGKNYNIVYEKPDSDVAYTQVVNAHSEIEAAEKFKAMHPTCNILSTREAYCDGGCVCNKNKFADGGSLGCGCKGAKFKEGGEVEDARILRMIKMWNEEHRAFSNVSQNDGSFFDAIGISPMEIGTTSQTGNDILYYDTNIYSSDTDALKANKFAKGGEVDDYHKSVAIENVKNGEFIRLRKGGEVFINKGYDRENKGYEIYSYEDSGKTKILKKGRKVFIGFTYEIGGIIAGAALGFVASYLFNTFKKKPKQIADETGNMYFVGVKGLTDDGETENDVFPFKTFDKADSFYQALKQTKNIKNKAFYTRGMFWSDIYKRDKDAGLDTEVYTGDGRLKILELELMDVNEEVISEHDFTKKRKPRAVSNTKKKDCFEDGGELKYPTAGVKRYELPSSDLMVVEDSVQKQELIKNYKEIEVKYIPVKKKDRFKIKSSGDASTFFKNKWNENTIEMQEEFYILLMNRANEVLGYFAPFKGGVTGTVADDKIIFGTALKALASSIIVAHNHPSGNLNPSEADIALTKKLKQIGTMVSIPVLDHLIITKESYYSFADEGIL
jgi:DNA repair protein RadC